MKNPPKDTHLWHELIKGIKPLKHRPPPITPSGNPTNPIKIQEDRIREYFDQYIQVFENDPYRYAETKKIYKIGKVVVEAKLDLHGLTREEAQHRLQKFVAMAHYDHLLWVLVITGKGHSDNPHTLKKLLPQWVEKMPLVTGYCFAKDKHGGQGAYYLRIKAISNRAE